VSIPVAQVRSVLTGQSVTSAAVPIGQIVLSVAQARVRVLHRKNHAPAKARNSPVELSKPAAVRRVFYCAKDTAGLDVSLLDPQILQK